MSEPSTRRRLLTAAAVFAAALAPRLAVAFAWAPKPVWDGYYYDIGARSIAAGMGYVGLDGKLWCHYPVGYSALLGGVYALVGSHAPIVGKILGAVCGALLAAAIYLLALRATSERRAVIAGLLVAIYPGFVAYAALHMTEVLSALLLVLAALAAGPGRRRAAAGGFVLGLATLVRPQSVVLAPLMGIFERGAPMRARLRAGAIATAAALAVALPWSVRNCVMMDGCAFVSTNGGWNLAIGSFPRATGRFETLRPGDGCHVVIGQVQQDRCWMRLGLHWIADDPARWLGLMPKKLAFTFDHESFPIGYLGKSDPEAWTAEDETLGRGLLSLAHRLLLTFATLAVLPPPRRSRPTSLLLPFVVALYAWYAIWTPPHLFWPLAILICVAAVIRRRSLSPPVLYGAAIVGTLIVIHAVFFGEDRYHLAATPLFCLLAATLGQSAPEGSPAKDPPVTCS